MRVWYARLGSAVWCLLMPALALAQTAAGSIAGVVKDTTGAVLPGVVVEAISPALIEKVRTVVSDGEGQYKIIELRPGAYTVTFTLPGFSVVKREGIELTTGFTATVNADLQVGDVSETITVSGQSPVVDIQNTRQQVVLTRDVIDTVPTGRSFQNLGVLIPGIVSGQVVGSTIPQDVGGQSGQSFMTMAIHGGKQTDQRIEVDGMSMSAWTRADSSAVVFADGNFEEYAIDVAAKSAESETGGVRINMIPKEGGSIFKGTLFANFAATALQSANLSDELRQRGLADANRLKALWSVNPTLGGPIKQDKIWFFAGYTYSRIDQYVAGSYLNKDPAAWDYVPDFTQQGVDDQYSRDVSGRLTWQATTRNKFTAFYSDNFTCHCHFLIGRASGATPRTSDGSTLLHIPNTVVQATWSSPVTNRLLIEAGTSYALQDINFLPRPESVAPMITDTGFNVQYRASTTNSRAYAPVYSSRGSVSYVTGSHAAKVGFNLITGYNRNDARLVGDMVFTALNGVPTGVEYRATPFRQINRVRPNLGIFAQDQWTLTRLTMNMGLRFDYFRSDYPDQTVPPTQFVPVTRSFPGLEAVSWKDISPRLGISYDLFGNGETAVKASVNRYVQGEGVTRATTINPIGSNNIMTRSWSDQNNDRVPQGDPFNPAVNGELGRSDNLSFGKPVIPFRYDPEWATGFGERQYNWEFSAGVQRQLVPRVSASAAYFRRLYGSFAVTDNLSIEPGDYDEYCVTAPVDVRLPGGGGQPICGLFDLNPLKVGQVNRVGTGANKFGNQYERWNGVDLTVNARLPQVLLQGGVSTGTTMDDNCEIVAKVPEAALVGLGNGQRFCHNETPYLTQLKFLGAYTMPWDVQISGTFQSVPGPQITASATFTNAQIAPSLGRALSSASTATIDLVQPGTLYADRMNQLDLRITKIFRLGRTRLQGMADLYNALNDNTVLVESNVYGATTGAKTGAAWRVPQAIMPGRVVKFGVQMNF
jgi:hypothetical protein